MKGLFLVSSLGGLVQVGLSQVYDYYNNGHYIGVYTGGSSITWNDASSYCNTRFGTALGSIHSATDNANAIDALDGAGMTTILTGTHPTPFYTQVYQHSMVLFCFVLFVVFTNNSFPWCKFR